MRLPPFEDLPELEAELELEPLGREAGLWWCEPGAGGGRCGVGCYDQLCCPASPKLLLGLDLGLGCDNIFIQVKKLNI